MSADAGADPNRSNSEVVNTPKKAREGIPGLLLMLLFGGHFRCPYERLEGTAETEETAETRS